ncbi:MAG TPA: FtsX-like permease family protein [Gammaproteobacteria bacterium]
MKYLGLLWANLRRRRMRLVFTLLSVLVAFLLFTYLAAVKTAFTAGLDVAGADRLVTIHKVSLIQLLPVSYANRIASVEGVEKVAHNTWFGGYYQDPKNQLAMFPVQETYFEIYPEYTVSAEHMENWRRERTGIIVGESTMRRFGWKVGDRVPISTGIWQNKDGSNTWEFTISGVYTAGKEGTDTTAVLPHYEYFEEARAFGEGMVGWFVIQIANADRAAEISDEIDALFANSPYETKTSPEKAFMQGFMNQIGDIGAIFTAIVSVVFFTLLLVAGNTMAQSVRERTPEIAVLKALGFTNARIVRLLLAESLLLAALGGGTGLGLAWWLVTAGGDPTGGFLPAFFVETSTLVLGVAMIFVLGLASGALPAWQAARLNTVTAFRKVV